MVCTWSLMFVLFRMRFWSVFVPRHIYPFSASLLEKLHAYESNVLFSITKNAVRREIVFIIIDLLFCYIWKREQPRLQKIWKLVTVSMVDILTVSYLVVLPFLCAQYGIQRNFSFHEYGEISRALTKSWFFYVSLPNFIISMLL